MGADDVYQQMPDLLPMLTAAIGPLLLLPLAEMAEANERMQTLAPVIAPTEYHHGGADNLRDQRRLIDAALALQRVAEGIAAGRTAKNTP